MSPHSGGEKVRLLVSYCFASFFKAVPTLPPRYLSLVLPVEAISPS